MKFNKPLDTILNTEAKTRILRFLCMTNAEWNGNQIAREIGITPPATHTALNALFEEGVLQLRNMGKTHVYSLKQGSFLVMNLLKPLFAKEGMLLEDIISMIKRKILSSKVKKEILSVVLFGSVSIRQEGTASDIDVAIIVESAGVKAVVGRLFEEVDARVVREFGNTVSLYVNTQSEFKAKYKRGLGVIKSILMSYKMIYGKRLENLL